MPLIPRITDPQPGDRFVFVGTLATITERSDNDGRIGITYQTDDGSVGIMYGWRDGGRWGFNIWPIDPYEAPPPPDIGTRWRHENGTTVTVTDTDGAGNTAHVTTSGQPWGDSRHNIVVFYGTHDPA